MDAKKMVEEYLSQNDWRVKENSSVIFSIGSLSKHLSEKVSAEYWLNEVYNHKITRAHKTGDFHIHDLGGLTIYCCGYSLKNIITMGVAGVSNIPKSKPAKHFAAIVNQICNLATIYQNEIKGAVAFNSVDTLLAPYIKEDNLTYTEVKQNIQNMVFSLNSNSRGGAEPSFVNMTFDLCPTQTMKDEFCLHGDKVLNYTYKDVQDEINIFNKAFFEVMLEGDANGKPFPYPIPTYNINNRFDWDNNNNEALWEMTGKYGYPYFSNFVNSDLNPDDVRSMCCRLNLDLKALRKRNGGLFGSADSTGSIGVVTINLSRLGNKASTKLDLLNRLDDLMDLAADSLEAKRIWLQENVIDKNLIPAYNYYVGTLNNHFSTIGIIGMNELCINFLGYDILSKSGINLSKEILQFMRDKMLKIQERTGNLYNLEASPAEGVSYRLAKLDSIYNSRFVQGIGKDVYYTNSSHMPVHEVENITQLLDHQENFQNLYTGGTVTHIYINNPISKEKAKEIIKYACTNYTIPYISLSPVNRICEDHGLIVSEENHCHCGKEFEKYQRVTGYVRNVNNFNIGKKQEFKERKQL